MVVVVVNLSIIGEVPVKVKLERFRVTYIYDKQKTSYSLLRIVLEIVKEQIKTLQNNSYRLNWCQTKWQVKGQLGRTLQIHIRHLPKSEL